MTVLIDSILDTQPMSDSDALKNLNKRGFDFTQNASPNKELNYSFGTHPVPATAPVKYTEIPSTNPFVFGDSARPESPKVPRREKKNPKLTGLPKWFKVEDSKG